MWTVFPNNSLHSLTAFLRNEPDSVAAMLKSSSAITIGKAFYIKKMGAWRQIPKSGGFVLSPGADEEQTTNRALSSPFIDDLHQILELYHPWHCTFQERLPCHFPKAAVTHRQPELGKAWPFFSNHTA